MYQGKPLSFWLDQYYINASIPGARNAKREEASDAIRQIGTNAIPIFLGMLREKDVPFGQKLGGLLHRDHIAGIRLRNALDRNIRGEYGFSVLGGDASNAVPALIDIFEKDISTDSMVHAGFALASLGSAAKPAIPPLLRALTNSNLLVRKAAMTPLARIHDDPEKIVPVLIQCCQDTNRYISSMAIYGLKDYGQLAVPTLVKLLSDPNQKTREAAAAALKQIDPETAAKAGVK
jgi:hypothetical protein